jgi:dethiobiotin synthetase
MFEENLTSLKEMMTAPFLGCVPFLEDPSAENAADYVDIAPLYQGEESNT